MTQKEKILFLLRKGPCKTTEFLYTRFPDGKMVTNEWRARISELRREGYQIEYDSKTKLYRLMSEPRSVPKLPESFHLDANGQIAFA